MKKKMPFMVFLWFITMQSQSVCRWIERQLQQRMSFPQSNRNGGSEMKLETSLQHLNIPL